MGSQSPSEQFATAKASGLRPYTLITTGTRCGSASLRRHICNMGAMPSCASSAGCSGLQAQWLPRRAALGCGADPAPRSAGTDSRVPRRDPQRRQDRRRHSRAGPQGPGHLHLARPDVRAAEGALGAHLDAALRVAGRSVVLCGQLVRLLGSAVHCSGAAPSWSVPVAGC